MSEFDNEVDSYKEKSEEYENILIELSNTLTIDDISFILSEIMKNNNNHIIESKAYDKSTGKDLVYFRMCAEFGYYLDDDEAEDEEE